MEYVISKQCAACGQVFRPRPQFPDQTYCSVPECQRERRRHWQQEKRRTDPDYRDNQNRVNKSWAEDNPEYWGKYRDDHPHYTERNREQQQERNRQRRATKIAKMGVSKLAAPLPSGKHRRSCETGNHL